MWTLKYENVKLWLCSVKSPPAFCSIYYSKKYFFPSSLVPCPTRLQVAIPEEGDTLMFASYVGSGPASTVHPQKISEISSTQKKNTWNYAPWPQEKTLKFIEVTLKYSPVLWWPSKISTQFSYKKIFVFLKTPKNIEIQILSQKMTEPTYVWKYERHPPPCCYYMHFYCFVQIQRIIISLIESIWIVEHNYSPYFT